MTTREDEIRARLEAFRLNPYSEVEADGSTKELYDLEVHAPADIDYLLKENQRLREALSDIRHAVRDPRVKGTQLCKNIEYRATQVLEPNETTTR